MSPTLAALPGVTLVLVGEPILTPSSNPALRGVNLEVVGDTPQTAVPMRSADEVDLCRRRSECWTED